MSSDKGESSKIELAERLITVESNGRSLPLFTVGPDDDKSYPGLIVVHEIFGLNDHIKDVARRFASQSLRVFAPDLFAGANELPEDRNNLDAMRKVWASIPDAHLIKDMQSVFGVARSNPGVLSEKIGAIGYCMGGAIAFMFACETPEAAWIVDYYGRVRYPQLSENKPKHPVQYAEKLNCPVLGIFAGRDDLITAEDRKFLADSIKGTGQTIELKVYEDAPHAFFNDVREHYNAAAATDAWQLTLRFIDNLTKVAR